MLFVFCGTIENGLRKSLHLSLNPDRQQKIETFVMAAISIVKSYKFRTCANKSVTAKFDNTLNLCRELYNAALQERRDAYKLNRVSITYQDQQNQLPEIKSIRDDLNSVYSQVLQDVLKRLDKTFKAFFARAKKGQAGFPRFKGANRYDSFCYPQSGFSLSENKLTLSKIGTVKLKLSQKVIGKVKTCTIKRECGKWFVIFSVETAVESLPKTGKQIGIDVGIESFAILSDGTQIDNWKFYEQSQKKLRVAQRALSRKRKGSNCRRKAVEQLQKVHRKIKNQRSDFQHKVSTWLVKEFDLIAIEKLNILGLSKGLLSKQILDVSWGSFFEKIRYKAANAGRELKEVSPNYTSQTCLCGQREKKTLSERWHDCKVCGLSIHRDILSAQIILKLGLGQSLESLKWNNSSCFDSESPPITVSV